VAKLVQPAAQGNTPGAGFLAEFVLRWLHAWLCLTRGSAVLMLRRIFASHDV